MAGTDRALYHSRRELSRVPTTAEWVRLGWEEIAGLAWDADSSVVTVTGLLPTVPPRTVVPLSEGPHSGRGWRASHVSGSAPPRLCALAWTSASTGRFASSGEGRREPASWSGWR